MKRTKIKFQNLQVFYTISVAFANRNGMYGLMIQTMQYNKAMGFVKLN